MKVLPQSNHPDLLVGFNKADDAGVFRLNETTALVQTLDFFPPIVDDPYQFGRIAAANALSDVFAMGGRPITALNIVGFPVNSMPPEILTEILRGGNDKIEEAGAIIVGGHSIKDKELKYGVAVTGIVDPRKVVSNAGASVGDILFLTKPLGTGIVTTAIKQDAVDDDLANLVIELMASLNQEAAKLMTSFGVTAATDITGFGLLGHTNEMAAASEKTICLQSKALPILPGLLELVEKGMIPGGANDNRKYLSDKVFVDESIDKNLEKVLFDPQTSGGLLISIPSDRAEKFSQALKDINLPAASIGTVGEKSEYSVVVE